MKALFRAAILAAAVLGLARPAHAEPWPDFSMTRLADGAAVPSRTLVADRATVVVVVRPSCAPCRTVVHRLTAEVVAGHLPPDRLIVIFSGVSRPEAAAFKALVPSLLPSAWYADDAGRAVEALQAHAVPLVIGVKRGEIGWSLRGSQFTDAFVHDLILPWFR
jgi:hypothetical protein